MRARSLGKAGFDVSELALGTWGLSGEGYGPIPESEQDRVIERAAAIGITLFETADAYGRGAMEKRLGVRLADVPHVRVVTKLGTDREATPPRKQFSADYLRTAFEKSRERLRREVDIVLLHNPAAITVKRGEATGVLADLESARAIRAWGVSAGSVDVARAAIEKGAAVISLAYSALFSADLTALREDIRTSGVGVLAHSVLSYGLLSGYWSLHKEFPPGDHRGERWTPDELRRRVGQQGPLRALVSGEIQTQRAAALRYVLANEQVGSAVLGPKSAVQLDQLVREAGKEPPYLTKEQLESLEFRLGQLGVEK